MASSKEVIAIIKLAFQHNKVKELIAALEERMIVEFDRKFWSNFWSDEVRASEVI